MKSPLTFNEKQVMDLRSQGHTQSECARIFRTTIGRIRSLEERARKKLLYLATVRR